jgi:hypothetical protein
LVTTSGGTGALSVTGTTGSGSVVLATSPTLVTPALGTPSALVGTNISGTAANLTAGKATVLATARTINGVSFDGSANITVPAGNTYSMGTNLTTGNIISGTSTFYTITSGASVTLPAASTAGQHLIIVCTNVTTGSFTITRAGTDTIQDGYTGTGANLASLNLAYVVELISDGGGKWYVVVKV